MKKLFGIMVFIVFATVAVAQTPQEIISRMEAEMEKHEKDGVSMIVDVKIPILGTMTTHTYTLGDKMCFKVSMLGTEVISWVDGDTEWTYNSKDNEIEIRKSEGTGEEGDMSMFIGITDGYDVSIDKETTQAWYLLCKKSKSNPDKDAPKKIDLVVAKRTYFPISLKTKVSNMTMTMRDISFGVTEKQVTFDAKDYPGTIIKTTKSQILRQVF